MCCEFTEVEWCLGYDELSPWTFNQHAALIYLFIFTIANDRNQTNVLSLWEKAQLDNTQVK